MPRMTPLWKEPPDSPRFRGDLKDYPETYNLDAIAERLVPKKGAPIKFYAIQVAPPDAPLSTITTTTYRGLSYGA